MAWSSSRQSVSFTRSRAATRTCEASSIRPLRKNSRSALASATWLTSPSAVARAAALRSTASDSGTRCWAARARPTSSIAATPPSGPIAARASRSASNASNLARAVVALARSSATSTGPPPSSRHSARRNTSSRRRAPVRASPSASTRTIRRARARGTPAATTSPYSGCANRTTTRLPCGSTTTSRRSSSRSSPSVAPAASTRASSSVPPIASSSTTDRCASSMGPRRWPINSARRLVGPSALVDRQTARSRVNPPDSTPPRTSSRTNSGLPFDRRHRSATVTESTGPPRTASTRLAVPGRSSGPRSIRSARPSFQSWVMTDGRDRPERMVITNEATRRLLARWTSAADWRSSRWASSIVRTIGPASVAFARSSSSRRARRPG